MSCWGFYFSAYSSSCQWWGLSTEHSEWVKWKECETNIASCDEIIEKINVYMTQCRVPIFALKDGYSKLRTMRKIKEGWKTNWRGGEVILLWKKCSQSTLMAGRYDEWWSWIAQTARLALVLKVGKAGRQAAVVTPCWRFIDFFAFCGIHCWSPPV